MPERLTEQKITEIVDQLAINKDWAYQYIGALIAEVRACWKERAGASGEQIEELRRKLSEVSVAYEGARIRYEKAEKERDEARVIADKKHEAIEVIGAETKDFVSKIHEYLDTESVPCASTADGEYGVIERISVALKWRNELGLATRAELINLGKVQAQLVERVRQLEKELKDERLVTADLRKQREARHRDIELILTEVERLRSGIADTPAVKAAKEVM